MHEERDVTVSNPRAKRVYIIHSEISIHRVSGSTSEQQTSTGETRCMYRRVVSIMDGQMQKHFATRVESVAVVAEVATIKSTFT